MYAAKTGNVARARFLLDRGAIIDACTHFNKDKRANCGTALMFASRKNHVDVVRLLIERGANLNAARIGDGMTALMIASLFGHLDVARLLVENGANVNACSDEEVTALMIASERVA